MDLAPVELNPKTRVFYVKSLAVLNESGVPFLVGGAYALAKHASIERHTKDLDIFVRPDDRDAVLAALDAAGYRTEVSFPHWLAKAYGDDGFIDVIYSSGCNGVSSGSITNGFRPHASDGEILGVPVKLCPAEEMIWSKGYVQERERFDGADIAHLIRCRGERPWTGGGCVNRFGEHWARSLRPSRRLRLHLLRTEQSTRYHAGSFKSFLSGSSPRLKRPSPCEGPDVFRDVALSREQYLPGHR